MKNRLNKDHQIPCACLECDKYPKRARYTEKEWEETHPVAEVDCRFCDKRARSHASCWRSDGIMAGGACPMSGLSANGIDFSIPFDDGHSDFSSEHFYVPSDE